MAAAPLIHAASRLFSGLRTFVPAPPPLPSSHAAASAGQRDSDFINRCCPKPEVGPCCSLGVLGISLCSYLLAAAVRVLFLERWAAAGLLLLTSRSKGSRNQPKGVRVTHLQSAALIWGTVSSELC